MHLSIPFELGELNLQMANSTEEEEDQVVAVGQVVDPVVMGAFLLEAVVSLAVSFLLHCLVEEASLHHRQKALAFQAQHPVAVVQVVAVVGANRLELALSNRRLGGSCCIHGH